MDQQKKIKKIALLRGSVRPAKRDLLATIKKRIKDLLAKKEASKDAMTQTKYDKEIKSARAIIGSLKAIQTFEIIKFGLHTDCDQMQVILQKGQADVNTRAMARLCSKVIMQKAFQEFKVNNPDWEKIPISAFKAGKGTKKSKKNDEDKKTKGRKGLRPRKQNKKEISTEQNKVETGKSPKKKSPVKKEISSPIKKEAIPSPIKKEEKSPVKKEISSPIKKEEKSPAQSPKKVTSPKKAPTPKKQVENVDESKNVVKLKLEKKIKASASPVAATQSPAKKLNKKRKVSDTASNVSFGRESTGLPDKTPKRVKFDDELTKTQKNKSQPDSTPKSALKPIIKKTPSDTKQKIQKSTRGNSLSERSARKKISI